MQPVIKQSQIKIVPVTLAQKFTISEIPGLRHTQRVVLGPKGFVPVHSVEIDAIELGSLDERQATEIYGQIRSIFQRARKEDRG
jgi:hypothetical protein